MRCQLAINRVCVILDCAISLRQSLPRELEQKEDNIHEIIL